jgi:hypothetical protein
MVSPVTGSEESTQRYRKFAPMRIFVSGERQSRLRGGAGNGRRARFEPLLPLAESEMTHRAGGSLRMVRTLMYFVLRKETTAYVRRGAEIVSTGSLSLTAPAPR